jgi:hypothetical protein
MSDFSLLLNHPDRDEIISKLVTGSSPKEISQWLKLKYPGKDQVHLRLAQKLLKEFSTSPYLTDYYGQFKQDLSTVAAGGKIHKGLSESIVDNRTYQERLIEIADKEIDWTKMIEGLITVCLQRVEQVFDIMQEDPRKFKGDNYLLRYLSDITSAVERLKKLSLLPEGGLLQHNITAQAVEEQTAFLQEVIRDVLAEIDPDTAMLFLEKFHQRLSILKPPTPVTQEEKIKEMQVLEAKIVDLDDDDD